MAEDEKSPIRVEYDRCIDAHPQMSAPHDNNHKKPASKRGRLEKITVTKEDLIKSLDEVN
ncbi:MAG: hypothetical protein ACKO7R_05385 [Pseudanabaena sp.]